MGNQRSLFALASLLVGGSACSNTSISHSAASGGVEASESFAGHAGATSNSGGATLQQARNSLGGNNQSMGSGGYAGVAANVDATFGVSFSAGRGGTHSVDSTATATDVRNSGGGISGGGPSTLGGSPSLGGNSSVTNATFGGNAETGGRANAGGGAATSNGGTATGGVVNGGATTRLSTGGTVTGGTATGGTTTRPPTGGSATGGATCALTVSRVLVDSASGTLTANNTACEPTCSLSLPCGSSVTLTPKTGSTTGFAGWNDTAGACLGTTSPCVFSLTTSATVKATFQPFNRAFITSKVSSAKLGGLAGADETCRSLATAAGLASASSYVAFLSTDTTSAIDRLGNARGWLRLDNLAFADSITSIQSGALWHPLVITDTGTTAKLDSEVFTGSRADGTSNPGYNCNAWTDATTAYNVQGGAIGGGGALALTWASGDCTQIASAPFYCFGTAYAAPLPPPPAISGRRVFISTSNFAPASGKGIADADSLCVSNAVTYGICANGTNCPFKAVLAQNGASAKSHFTNQDGSSPVVRLDNVKVANSASYFWQGTLVAPIAVHANGSYNIQGARVFTGATTPSALGTKASTCNGWSDNSVTTGVNYGVPAMGPNWFNWASLWGCSSTNPIYCLEDIP